MSSIFEGYNYDIFISYRQKDNKHDGWVTEFVSQLKGELEATFKEDISIYFDENPSDGLLETHSVDKSLEGKLKCLIFIPIISQTYCDSKSFAWQNEFCAFNKLAKEDQFGRDIKLTSGNVASRILPIKIHDLDLEDKTLLENELGGVLRCIEFIYKEAGVNRPLKPNDDGKENLNKTHYVNQVNKVANAVKEIISALKKQNLHPEEVLKQDIEAKSANQKNLRAKVVVGTLILLTLIALGYFFIPKMIKSSTPLEKSVAVIPFTNLSNDPEQEYFSDGMVDAILDNLFKVGELKVISRTSIMRYKKTQLSLKQIAHELGVSAILEGSVQKIGNKVRITAQLIDTKSDTHLWSETYNRDLADIFSIYSEVAQNIAKALKVTLTSKETDLIQSAPLSTNQLAYDFYLKGNKYWSRFNISLALDMYSKAIEEDPSFAAAYAKRALVHLYSWWTKRENWPIYDLKAQEDIKQGLMLNQELPELKIAQATYYYYINRDYDNALKILNQLKTKTPNLADIYAYSSYVLRRKGDMENAILELKKAIQLDPFNPGYINELGNTYAIMHNYDDAITCSKQGISLFSDDEDFKLKIFHASISKTGDLNIALKESGLTEKDVQSRFYTYTRQYGKLLEFIRNDTTRNTDQQFYFIPKTFNLALVYYLSGDKTFCKIYSDSTITDLVQKIKENPNDDRYYATIGKCYAFIGKYDDAINCGKKAVDLKPIKLDAWQGAVKEQDLMEIYIYTGKNDLALDKMEHLLSIPSDLHVGDILINPIFDNLRTIPRFQKIISSAQKHLNVKQKLK
jgi:TolB-like protein